MNVVFASLGLLPGTKIVYLQNNSKVVDYVQHPHGHLNPVDPPEVITKNYGIVLDGRYLVVDIDNPDRVDSELASAIEPTWHQKTPKGDHYLYAIPEGFKSGNKKLRNSQGEIVGDIKTKGYIVGPGSQVRQADGTLQGYVLQSTGDA